MNRNSESHFAQIPHADISRSKFYKPSNHKTTFNAGQLIPIYCDEVLPGDTHQMDMSALIRMSTPIFPTMDNLFCDFYFFFVPNRLVWDHWKQFMGENTESYWTQPTEYQVPTIKFQKKEESLTTENRAGSLADYFGIPTNIDIEANALPIRAYCLIWNEWFRDQNTQQPCQINKDETTTIADGWKNEGKSNSGENYTNFLNGYIKYAQNGGACLPVNKYHDYFTSCLPQPQKGAAVLLPMSGNAPIRSYIDENMTQQAVAIGNSTNYYSPWTWGGTEAELTQNYDLKEPPNFFQSRMLGKAKDGYNFVTQENKNPTKTAYIGADLSAVTSATINQLRQAFQIQKLLERDARGGTRYTEILKAHFNVTSPDSRQQRPEYLGGYRMPINITQVVQNSETTAKSPQGNTAAFSVSGMNKSMFTKSFTEHGYIIGLAAVRTEHTYQQGLERLWNRKSRYDFYWPELANIGEQAVLNKEIYAQGTDADEEAFGYQEAWADYRYKPNRVSGDMRSNYKQTLDSWHYADYYTEQPKLSSTWMMETANNIDRTLAVQSSVEDQFIADFYFKAQTTRPMPVYSVPGLMDHH